MAQLDLANPNTAAKRNGEMTIGQALEKAIPHLKMALPKSMDAERMARVALTNIRRSYQLQECNVNSLAGAILESASLGLEIDSRGLAYLVPYNGNATLIIGYKGLMQLAYRSGKLNNIYADVAYKAEVDAGMVEIGLGADRSLRHDFDILKSATLRTESDSNPIVLAYAVAVFKDGSKHFEFVTEAEVTKRRKSSAAGDKGFLWNKNKKTGVSWLDEAWKKTAIRKLCKYMDLSPETQRAIVLDEQADTGEQHYEFAEAIDVDFAVGGNSDETPEESATPEQADSAAALDAEQPVESLEPESKEIECPLYGTTVRTSGCPTCKRYDECPHWQS